MNGSCCTKEIETIMLNMMKEELATVYQNRIIALKQSFNYHYELFDKQYNEGIDASRKQLHVIFTRTYGPLYQSNAQIFDKLFEDLREFYKEQSYISIKPMLDRFFFDLFRTLLLILNPTSEIREDNSDCSKNSLVLQAFGDIPLKMIRQLERSLGAARSLTHALKSSCDILQDIIQKELPTDCQITATQMKYCVHCLPTAERITISKSLKPCQMYCLDTINKCFADYIIIENTWQQFIEALTKLATRLRGPYNTMAVLIPLAVQISESIMIFQEKASVISSRISRKCLRKDSGQSLKHEIATFKTSSEPLPDFPAALSNAQSQLLTSFIGKLEESRGFWKIGPRLSCVNSTWSVAISDNTCWDGKKVVNNLETVTEMSDDGVFLTERLKLLMLSNRLLDSYEGRQLFNESIDADVEASGNGDSYHSIDDEDGDEFRDEGSGSEENLAVVVDVASSHRDTTGPLATEESDLQSSSTSASEPSVTLKVPDVEIVKISSHKPFPYILYFLTIFHIL
ncbi:Glypican family protein [Acanthocheilonema viteae]